MGFFCRRQWLKNGRQWRPTERKRCLYMFRRDVSYLNMKIKYEYENHVSVFRWVLSDNYTKLLLTNEITVKCGTFLLQGNICTCAKFDARKNEFTCARDCAHQIKSPDTLYILLSVLGIFLNDWLTFHGTYEHHFPVECTFSHFDVF